MQNLNSEGIVNPGAAVMLLQEVSRPNLIESLDNMTDIGNQ